MLKNTIYLIAGLLACSCLCQPVIAACNTYSPKMTPDDQFSDNSDGTITDKKTGLMWMKCSAGQQWNALNNGCDGNGNTNTVTYDWQDALNLAQVVNGAGFAGQVDWRLPNAKELASIVEGSCQTPAINALRFPDTSPNTYYWSSSPSADGAEYAWAINFDDGSVNRATLKSGSWNMRFVRGGL